MKTLALFLSLAVAIASANEVGEARTDGVINLSNAMSTNNAALYAIIIGFLLLDVVLGAVYFGDLTLRKRRRNSYLRRHYQQRQYYPSHSHYRHRIGAVGEDSDVDSNQHLAFQSLDLVDTTFGILNVESKACRERAICQLERAATQNAVLGFLTSNLNSYINGMDKYEGAIYRGRNGQSCEEIYAECTKPVSDTWNLFKRR